MCWGGAVLGETAVLGRPLWLGMLFKDSGEAALSGTGGGAIAANAPAREINGGVQLAGPTGQAMALTGWGCFVVGACCLTCCSLGLQVHPRRPLLLLPTRRLLPPPGRWQGGLVRLPPVRQACHVEDDAQH